MAKLIKPPHIWQDQVIAEKVIFLAGSIEMGAASDWQTELVNSLTDWAGVLLSPRRDNWDPSWEQSSKNPKFVEQVTWELDGLENSDAVIFYFDPNTKSPVTLLELGMMIGLKKKIIVCCPPGFWRRGNVEITCTRYNIKMVDGLDNVSDWIRSL